MIIGLKLDGLFPVRLTEEEAARIDDAQDAVNNRDWALAERILRAMARDAAEGAEDGDERAADLVRRLHDVLEALRKEAQRSPRVVNLTPHAVTLSGPDGSVTIEPSGRVARVGILERDTGVLDIGGVTVPVYETAPYAEEEPPPAEAGTIYIVSRQVAEAFPERSDLFVVHKTVRDEEGRIVGAKALARVRP